ncbi:hypothetical protein [Bremerella cremea]|uniref:hypothetical protein n=1 Tax=Bremerella cremea TaxID=1031537 RepID=UPI0011C07A56|nr:hypothetical protein [Bremerella cremea]
MTNKIPHAELSEAALRFGFWKVSPIEVVLPESRLLLSWSGYVGRYSIGDHSYGYDYSQRVLAENGTIVAKLPPRQFGSHLYQAGSFEVASNLFFDVASTLQRETTIRLGTEQQNEAVAYFDSSFYRWSFFSRQRKFYCQNGMSPLATALAVATAIDWAID